LNAQALLLTTIPSPAPTPDWQKRVSEFEASVLKGFAKVRLTQRGARRLSEMSAASAEALRCVSQVQGKAFIEATVPIESVDHAVAQFLRLGDDIEVLSPQPLRSNLADVGARLIALDAKP